MRRLWIRSTFGAQPLSRSPGSKAREARSPRPWIGSREKYRGEGKSRKVWNGRRWNGRAAAKVSVISAIVSLGCLHGWPRVSVFRRQFCGRLQAARSSRESPPQISFEKRISSSFLFLSLILIKRVILLSSSRCRLVSASLKQGDSCWPLKEKEERMY